MREELKPPTSPSLEQMLVWWGCISPKKETMNFTDALKTGKPMRCSKLLEGTWIQWNDKTNQFDLIGNSAGKYVPMRDVMLMTDWEVKPDILPWHHKLEEITKSFEFGPNPIGFKLKGFCVSNITRRHHDFGRAFNMHTFHYDSLRMPSLKITIEFDDGQFEHAIQGVALGVELSDRDGKVIETVK